MRNHVLRGVQRAVERCWSCFGSAAGADDRFTARPVNPLLRRVSPTPRPVPPRLVGDG